MSAQVHDRITIEPDKMDGQPCVRCCPPLRVPMAALLAVPMVGV